MDSRFIRFNGLSHMDSDGPFATPPLTHPSGLGWMKDDVIEYTEADARRFGRTAEEIVAEVNTVLDPAEQLVKRPFEFFTTKPEGNLSAAVPVVPTPPVPEEPQRVPPGVPTPQPETTGE